MVIKLNKKEILLLKIFILKNINQKKVKPKKGKEVLRRKKN